MQTFLIVIHVFLAVAIIVLVLMQHGKGASLGASFGAGSGASMFGPVGASNFLSRATGVMIAAFFTVSMLIAIHGKREANLATQFPEEELPVLPQELHPDDERDETSIDSIVPPLE